MRFRKFLEETNPGAFVQANEPPFGHTKSPGLPTLVMNDKTEKIVGKVIDVQKEKGNSVVEKEEGSYKTIIKVKTPRGVYRIEHEKGNVPKIGQPMSIILNRFGEVESYN